MINYKALEGHPYDIKSVLDPESDKVKRILVCGYDGCCKEFSKTWNLVYHFRIHTQIKPFTCKLWSKNFAQKSNLQRHEMTHRSVEDRKQAFSCEKCSKNYTSIYNLNVSFWFSYRTPLMMSTYFLSHHY